MARRRGPSNPAATRQQIVDCATELFADNGYGRTSLAEIARAVGITAPSLIYYFPNKATLFDEVARTTWHRLAEELRPAFGTRGSARKVVATLFSMLFLAEEREAALATAISSAILSDPDLGADAIHDTLLPMLAELEIGIRAIADPPIHPDAPLREVLIYIALANASRRRLTSILDTETRLDGADLVFMGLALFDGVAAWQPSSDHAATGCQVAPST